MTKVKVLLRGGPANGARVEVESGTGLIIEGLGVPEGEAARYRPTRERGVYRFKGLTKIVARLPLPGMEDAA